MTTVETLGTNQTYDYVVVSGGTAGCAVASRLTAELPTPSILSVEAGESDLGKDYLRELKQVIDSWGTDHAYKYSSVPQLKALARQDSRWLLYQRLHLLSPSEYEVGKWPEAGAHGWPFDEMVRLVDKLPVTVNPVLPKYYHSVDQALVKEAQAAFNITTTNSFNTDVEHTGKITPSAGYLAVVHNPDKGYRSSASMAYTHPILRGEEKRPNLTILTVAWAHRVNFISGVTASIAPTLKSGRRVTVKSAIEAILCAGAFDSPRLLLLSGVGPRTQLEHFGIHVVTDVRAWATASWTTPRRPDVGNEGAGATGVGH